jgi:hypothetical protein
MEDRCERAAKELNEDFEQFYGTLPPDLRASLARTLRRFFASPDVFEIAMQAVRKNMAEPHDPTARRIARQIMQELGLWNAELDETTNNRP